MDSLRTSFRGCGAARAAAGPIKPSPGLKILVPGYAQWSWRQRERGLLLFSAFAAAIAVAVFAWGTWTGTAVLVFALVTHVVSVLDVLRQSNFPGFRGWMPALTVSGGLSVGVYGPTLALASMLAWPGFPGAESLDGYAVNWWAYRGRDPERGEWVWFHPSRSGEPAVGRIIAGPGQEVEWSGNRLSVDGGPELAGTPEAPAWPPGELAFTVPRGHVLIEPAPNTSGEPGSRGLRLVACDRVVGHAWARLYPIQRRRLLD